MANVAADIYLKGEDLDNIRGMLQTVFTQNGFKVAWKDQYSGQATKGSKVGQAFAGAFATYHEIGFNIFKDPGTGQILVHLERHTSGVWGGIVGLSMVRKRFAEVRDMLANYFMAQGVLDRVAGE